MEPTLTIRLPLPHVNINEAKLSQIKNAFRSEGETIRVIAEYEYPIPASWAELVIIAGTFLAGTIAKHYTKKILDAFDALVREGIDKLSLQIRSGRHSVNRDIPLKDRAKAVAAIESAFLELKRGIEGDHYGVLKARLYR